MHAFITFKATRKPRTVQSGLPQAEAIAAASHFYDQAKILSDHELLASGVSVMVVTDEEAQAFEESGRIPHGFKPLLQCGGW
jgi:hypothetical protein